jgi:hypothetical protein
MSNAFAKGQSAVTGQLRTVKVDSGSGRCLAEGNGNLRRS